MITIRCVALLIAAALICGGCAPLLIPSNEEEQQLLRLIDEGSARLRRGEFDLARAAFEMALELGDSAAAVDGLGCVAFLSGEHAEAELAFNRALEIDPDYIEAVSHLALLDEFRGDDVRAIERYDQVLWRDPLNIRARNNRAGAVLRLEGDAGTKYAQAELKKAALLESNRLIEDNLRRLSGRGE